MSTNSQKSLKKCQIAFFYHFYQILLHNASGIMSFLNGLLSTWKLRKQNCEHLKIHIQKINDQKCKIVRFIIFIRFCYITPQALCNF